MKKILLLSFFVLLLFSQMNSFGQSLTLSWDGHVLGDTVSVLPSTDSELTFSAIVNNVSDNSFMVNAARIELSMPSGATSSFRWEQNYGPTTDTATSPKFIPSMGSSNDDTFLGRYKPNGSTEVAMIKYSFYKVDDPSDAVSVVVKYMHTPSATEETLVEGVSFSNVYPNPGNNVIHIDYRMAPDTGSSTLRIVNILGVVVKEVPFNIDNNTLQLDISDLKGGIYFYSISIDEKVYKTKKLIVR